MSDKNSISSLLEKVKELEIKLLKVEFQRKAILDSLPFMAWLKDKEHRYIYVNQSFIDFFQKPLEEIIGKTDASFFTPEETERFHATDRLVFENKKTYNTQEKTGEYWFSTVKAPIIDEMGAVIGLSGFARNDTDNVELVTSLRYEQDLLSSLMDNIPDTIYFKNLHSQFIRINKAKAYEIGLSDLSEAIGKSESDFLKNVKSNNGADDERQILSTGIPLINKEERATTFEGYDHWMSTTKAPIFDDRGNITGLVGISRDITKLKHAMQKLDQESEFLQFLMNFIPYTIYFKDRQCRFTKVNLAQAKLIGLDSPDEAIGKTDFDFFAHEHAKAAYEDEIKIMESGEPLLEKVELVKDSNDQYHWVSATKIPIRNDKGEITGIVGISIDVTEKRIAEEKLRIAKEKAEESDKLKSAFLANMSHEIRTPMNGIIGFSNLMRNPEISDADRNEFLGHITSCGNLLLNLIDDIIDISKIEAGQIKIRINESNVNYILNEIYNSFEATRQRDGKDAVELIKVIGLADNQATITTDPFRLRQIISNLVANALKFTVKGSVEFGYSLNELNQLLFFVKDTGIGIPKEKQKIIFERFGQVLDNNFYINQKGTGLGLAISSNLVKLLGGEIWVDSEPAKGSTFKFTIPYTPVDIEISEELNEEVDDNIDKLAGKKILIAEDEEINFLFFKHLLKGSKANILWVKDGLEALDLVKQVDDLSIILMDCKMPQMDGYTSTREIRKFNTRIPIIAQTAFAMADEEEKAMQAGCNAFISKPIRIKELFALINKFL